MAYRFLEHTADIAIEVESTSLEELFADSLEALTDSITDLELVMEQTQQHIKLSATSREQLLVEWLGEAIFLFDTRDLLFCRAAVEIESSGAGWRLQATAWGEPLAPDRHPVKTAIKAATYHQLLIEPVAGGWRARFILDI
jgi:SHS2 domain-containing protein